MKAWRVILAAMVIFAAGAVTGGLTFRFSTHSPSHHGRSNSQSSSSWSPRQRGEFLERMQRELQLTEMQRTNIEKILSESQEQVKQLWETISPRLSEEYRRSRQRIREQLTAEQAEKFEKHFKHRGSSKSYDSKQGDNRNRSSKTEPP